MSREKSTSSGFSQTPGSLDRICTLLASDCGSARRITSLSAAEGWTHDGSHTDAIAEALMFF